MSSPNPRWQLLEAMAALRVPAAVDRRMQYLMDHNTNGSLDSDSRAELEALVELVENFALLRAAALKFLGRRPE